MDINILKDWANQNQGFLAIILFLVSLLIGWISGFFKWLFGKSVGNKTFIQKNGKYSKNIQGENITVNKYDNDK